MDRLLLLWRPQDFAADAISIWFQDKLSYMTSDSIRARGSRKGCNFWRKRRKKEKTEPSISER